MSTPSEREQTTRRVLETIKRCANGDVNAEHYLRTIMRVTRLADDLADGDQPAMDTHAATAELLDLVLVQLPINPFFLAHRDLFLAAHILAINAWAASNALATAGGYRSRYAAVWRDQVVDVFQLVARLKHRDAALDLNLWIREQFMKDEALPAEASPFKTAEPLLESPEPLPPWPKRLMESPGEEKVRVGLGQYKQPLNGGPELQEL